MGELKRVVVVGAGTMGSQIALQTALSGAHYEVTLVDSVAGQLERAAAQNKKLLDRSVEKGRVTADAAAGAMDRIKPSGDLGGAAKNADIVIEAVIEDFDAKKAVFDELGKHASKEAILTSNSSTIAISRLAEFTGRPERCCNTHFFHPVTVMQLCEVVRGPKTSDATVQTAMEFVRSIDRTPVLLKKEIWGFIVNRILFAAS
jgi:3-hydroxybutyryl-CoA dehydrogenase